MFIPSVYHIVRKMANEQTAVRAALFIRNNIPSNRLTGRLTASADDFLDFVQTTYKICHACFELITTHQEDPTIHDKCLKELQEDEAYWKNIESETKQERKEQEVLARQQKADEDAWSIYQSDQEALDRHEQEAAVAERREELDTPTYDEENVFTEETDDVTMAPVKKEN